MVNSSSDYSSITNDEMYLFQLSWVPQLLALFPNVKPVPEPKVASCPVAEIQYRPEFRSVMGLYRALRPFMVQSVTTGVFNPLHSPARWLLLLSFAMRQCLAHYTVFQDRRALLFSNSAMWGATQETLPAVHGWEPPGDHQDPCHTEEWRQAYADLIGHWVPAKADLGGPEGDGPLVWRVVWWELRTTACVARLYHKNFQIWHHRQEMVRHGLDSMGPTERSDALRDEAAFEAYLTLSHGISFSDVDERTLIDEVLGQIDSKNYHVWLYRSWYLDALPFLVHAPLNCAWDAFMEDKTTHVSGPFVVDPAWLPVGGEMSTLPACTLRAEMDYTARLIAEDRLNNSAWCHRFHVFRKYLVSHLLQQHEQAHRCGDTAASPTAIYSVDRLMDVLFTVCRLELNFSLQWAFADPLNECPFVHTRAVAELYQSALVRLHLFHYGGTSSTAHLLSDDPVVPTVAVCRGHTVVTNDDESGAVTRDAVAEAFLVMHLRMPWGSYVRSFQMLWFALASIQECILPRVARLEQELERLFSSCASTPTKPSAGCLQFYQHASQFMIDNLHQARAGLYHGLFSFLEQTWLLYWSRTQREEVQKLRPAETYVNGIASDRLSASIVARAGSPGAGRWKEDAAADAAFGHVAETQKNDYLELEAWALSLAKQLVTEDNIRSKYWKNEVRTLLYRKF